MRTNWISFSDFLKKYFPEDKVQKITLNGGFSCPTRDGKYSTGGCTYCNNKSFSPSFGLKTQSISEQINIGIDFFRHKYPNMRYIAYFQSYTNTYGDINDIISKYEEALSHKDIVGLIIGTRPDCMPDELLDYLEDVNKRTFLLVEYGVESTNDRTLKRVQRGHDFATSCDTIYRTAERGILVGAHLILGLPGESRDEMLDHAIKINSLPISTIKMHQLQIIKGTIMAKDYIKNPSDYHLFSIDEYIDFCIEFIDLLREDIVIERFSSSSPANLLLAPQWGVKNHVITDRIINTIKKRTK